MDRFRILLKKKPPKSDGKGSPPIGMPVTKDQIREKAIFENVKNILVDKGGCNPIKIALDARLDDLRIDSLDRIEILMALEDFYNVELPDDEADKIRTVGEIVQGLKKYVPYSS